MGDLSQHFSRHEFACRCCAKAVVSPELIASLRLCGIGSVLPSAPLRLPLPVTQPRR